MMSLFDGPSSLAHPLISLVLIPRSKQSSNEDWLLEELSQRNTRCSLADPPGGPSGRCVLHSH